MNEYKPGDKSWLRKGTDGDYNEQNISQIFSDSLCTFVQSIIRYISINYQTNLCDLQVLYYFVIFSLKESKEPKAWSR